MQLWIDIFDVDGKKMEAIGPIFSVEQITVRRILDGIGDWSMALAAGDLRALEQMTPGRRIVAYGHQFGTTRELVRGIVTESTRSAAAGSWTLQCSGRDALEELRRRIVYTGFVRNGTLEGIIQDLMAFCGWTAEVSPAVAGINTTIRADGASVFEALETVCKLKGVHFRLGEGGVLEVGYFGDDSDLVAVAPSVVSEQLYSRDEAMLITSMSVKTTQAAVANRVIPYGAGQNLDTAITLEDSDRDGLYAIQSYSANGNTYLGLEDVASINSEIGLIETIGQFDIAPIGTSRTARTLAANALYDAAEVWLSRNSRSQIVYSVAVTKVSRNVRAGNLIFIDYTFPQDKSSVADRFYVVAVNESFSAAGAALSLEVSNIDKAPPGTADVIIGAIKKIEVAGKQIQPSINHYILPVEQLLLDPDNAGSAELFFSDYTVNLVEVKMRIRSQPFSSTAKGTQSEVQTSGITIEGDTDSGGSIVETSEPKGAHDHATFAPGDADFRPGVVFADTFEDLPASVKFVRYYAPVGSRELDPGVHLTPYYFLVDLALSADVGLADEAWTWESANDHTHELIIPDHSHSFSVPPQEITIPAAELQYGIYRDASFPGGVNIEIDGVEVATGLGNDTSSFDVSYDITDLLLDTPAGFQGTHRIDVQCTSGRGEVVITFDIVEIIAPFKRG